MPVLRQAAPLAATLFDALKFSIVMDQEETLLLERAIQLQVKEDYSAALQILHSLEDRRHLAKPLFVLLARSYYSLDDYLNCAKYFKKATVVNPGSELASLGLFHSLMQTGKFTAAFRELDRFASNYPIKNYKITFAELNENIANFPSKFERDIIFTS